MASSTFYTSLFEEINQSPAIRQRFLREIQSHLHGACVLAYYTGFDSPVGIEDSDAGIIEDILLGSDLSRGLVLIISSPGGQALAAERIINICRAHSPRGFDVIVPKLAKSAATMICLGARSIIMSKTSELGPIDPQVAERIGDGYGWVPADLVIKSYRDLLDAAVNAGDARIEPYLQQLANYDSRLIAVYEREQHLTKRIAVETLKTGMMKDLSEDEIESRIKAFIDPEETSAHGRPILASRARACGLKVKSVGLNTPLWRAITEFHVRASHFLSRSAAKLAETPDHNFAASQIRFRMQEED